MASCDTSLTPAEAARIAKKGRRAAVYYTYYTNEVTTFINYKKKIVAVTTAKYKS